MAHKFVIKGVSNGQFNADFRYNSEKMIWSENYTAKASAQNAIESVKENAPGAAIVDVSAGEEGSGYRFEIKKSKDEQYYVLFIASNGQTVMRSELYTTKASAKNCAESVMKNAPGAEVEDEA